MAFTQILLQTVYAATTQTMKAFNYNASSLSDNVFAPSYFGNPVSNDYRVGDFIRVQQPTTAASFITRVTAVDAVGATVELWESGTNGRMMDFNIIAPAINKLISQWIADNPGPTGPQGPTGATGAQGIQGPKGDQGDAGPTGSAGAQGIQGIQGVQGVKGDTGDTGPKGDTGEMGPQGLQGVPGDVGPKGDKGDTGDVGPQGLQGETGNTGPKGDTGNTGSAGADGATGAAGPKGDKGDTGDVGPQGPSGVTIRIVRVAATSNASGVIAATYSPAFASAPNVQLQLLSTNDRDNVRLTASSATGFTAIVERRNATLLSLLGLDVLTAGVTPVSGALVNALIVEA